MAFWCRLLGRTCIAVATVGVVVYVLALVGEAPAARAIGAMMVQALAPAVLLLALAQHLDQQAQIIALLAKPLPSQQAEP